MVVIQILVAGMLGINGLTDVLWKKINLLLVAPFFLAGIVCSIVYHMVSPISILAGMGIGMVMLAVSVMTRGKIGIGDGILVITTGLFLGFFDNLFLLLTAAFLAAVVGTGLLFTKRVRKNDEIPFVPFLFIAFVGDLLLWK
jgi:leader peptidase (prepilin peptidase)/N-methyltransferase